MDAKVQLQIPSISIYHEHGSAQKPFGRRATLFQGIPDLREIIAQEVYGQVGSKADTEAGIPKAEPKKEKVMKGFKEKEGNMLVLGTVIQSPGIRYTLLTRYSCRNQPAER